MTNQHLAIRLSDNGGDGLPHGCMVVFFHGFVTGMPFGIHRPVFGFVQPGRSVALLGDAHHKF